MSADPITITPLAYSIENAAKAVGLSKATVERAVSTGELTVSKIGSRTLIPVWALENWLRENTERRGGK